MGIPNAGGLWAELRANEIEVAKSITTRWPWFVHEKPITSLEDVRKGGLVPRFPGPSSIVRATPDSAIVCLHPTKAKLWPLSMADGPKVLFAVSAADLPAPISLDWSYAADWVQDERERSHDKGIVEGRAVVSDERFPVPKPPGGFVYVRCHDLIVESLKLTICEGDTVQGFELLPEVRFKSSSIANVRAIFVLEVL